MAQGWVQASDDELRAGYSRALKEEDIAAARAVAEEMARRNPEQVQAWKRLGDVCYWNLSDCDRAAEAFAKARELDPADNDAIVGLTCSLMHADRYADAAAMAKVLVKRLPTAPHYTMLGFLLSKLGGRRAAEAALRQALRIDPTDDEALYHFTSVLPAERFSEALEAAERLVALHPKYGPGRAVRAWLRFRDGGDAAEAEGVLRGVVAADPASSDAWRWLGWVLEHSGDGEGAHAALRKTCELRPWDAVVQMGYARFLERIGDDDAAERFLRAAVEVTSTHGPLASRLLRFLIERGRAREAREVVERLLEVEDEEGGRAGVCDVHRGRRTGAAGRGGEPAGRRRHDRLRRPYRHITRRSVRGWSGADRRRDRGIGGSGFTLCGSEPPDVPLDRLADRPSSGLEVVAGLEVHPEPGGRAEVACEAQGGVGSAGARAFDQPSDTVGGHAGVLGEPVHRDAQGLKELEQQHFAGMDGLVVVGGGVGHGGSRGQ